MNVYSVSTILLISHRSMSHFQSGEILYQKEEHTSIGCCFSVLSRQTRLKADMEQPMTRFNSQPKMPKNRKINLVMPRKGMSQEKCLSRNPSANSERSNLLKCESNRRDYEQTKEHSLGSKIRTQVSSFRNSKVAFNKDVKPPTKVLEIQPVQADKTYSHPYRCTTELAPPPPQYLSEISLVSQEFISHDSGSLRTALKQLEKQEEEQRIGRIPHQNMFVPPKCPQPSVSYERAIDRKRLEMKRDGHKRLYL